MPTTVSPPGVVTWASPIPAPSKTSSGKSKVRVPPHPLATLLTLRVATHLSNYIFDGARADMTKTFSMNPLFQVTHSFALGSQTAPPSYNFGAIFATPQVRVCAFFAVV